MKLENWINLTLVNNLKMLRYKNTPVRQSRTWDPLLQCLYLDKHLLKQHNIKTLYATKLHTYAVGTIMNRKVQKDQNQLPFLRYLEQMQGAAPEPCRQHHQEGGQTTEETPLTWPTVLPPASLHLNDQLVSLQWAKSHLLLVFTAAEVPAKPCLASYQLIIESKDPSFQHENIDMPGINRWSWPKKLQ